MRRMKRIIQLLLILIVVGTGLYAFAPHPPATPQQVSNVTDLESYLNQLVNSGNPPVYR